MDYPGIGPEHSYLSDIGRAEYYAVTDAEALEAFQQVSRLEGIIPALETSHAFAYLKVTPLPLRPLSLVFFFLLSLEHFDPHTHACHFLTGAADLFKVAQVIFNMQMCASVYVSGMSSLS